MGQCIGYGKYAGCCPNCTKENGSPVFCETCAELRKLEVEKKRKSQEDAERKTEKTIKERM